MATDGYSMRPTANRQRDRRFPQTSSTVVVLVIGASAISLAFPEVTVSALGPLVGLIALAVAHGMSRSDEQRFGSGDRRIVAAAVMGLGLWSLAAYSRGSLDTPNTPMAIASLVVALAVVARAAVARADMSERSWSQVIFAAASTLVLVASLVWAGVIATRETHRIDVLLLHESAADALMEGQNPYIVATAPDTNPFLDEPTEFQGYVYPPTTLLAYSAASWVFGDARWAGVIAAIATTVLLIVPWQVDRRTVDRVMLAALFVAMPNLSLMFVTGWTDLLALPLLLLAVRAWRSSVVWSAIAIGLAVSTKSYFLLAAPILIVWDDDARTKRMTVAVATAAATFVPFAIADVGSILRLANGNALHAGFRPDSIGLAGLGVEVPRFVSLALSAGLAVWLGRRGGSGVRFVVALAVVLGLGFMTGFQAFVNYWVLVAGLALIGAEASLTTAGGSEGSGSVWEMEAGQTPKLPMSKT